MSNLSELLAAKKAAFLSGMEHAKATAVPKEAVETPPVSSADLALINGRISSYNDREVALKAKEAIEAEQAKMLEDQKAEAFAAIAATNMAKARRKAELLAELEALETEASSAKIIEPTIVAPNSNPLALSTEARIDMKAKLRAFELERTKQAVAKAKPAEPQPLVEPLIEGAVSLLYPEKEDELQAARELAASTPTIPASSIVPAIKEIIAIEAKKLSLADRLALKRKNEEDARKALEAESLASEPDDFLSPELASTDPVAEIVIPEDEVITSEAKNETFSLSITLNEKQLMAKEFALAGKNYCLIGAAGTGKTTTQRSVAETLVSDRRLRMTSYKQPGKVERIEAPSIAFVAYTRRASANLQRAIHKSPALAETLRSNIMTVHALLEFEPETYYDDVKEAESFRFIPKRTASNPLTITHLVIEEASMLGLDLWEQLFDALPLGVQIIFIGDINQLPPVFGASILNYALVQLPVVELTEVYRQQADSTIIANAHHILKGEPIEEGKDFTIIRGKSPIQVGQAKTAMTLGKMFEQFYDQGYYDPEDCMILSPWNKKDLGTDNMNSWIAQFLGARRNAVVWEVISGFSTLYLAVGDKVMYNKQDAIITDIKFNGMYHGKEPQASGTDLGRFGVRILGASHINETELEDQLLAYTNFSVDDLAESTMERKQQASHVVTIQTETGQILNLSNAGDFGPQVFSLGYVLTVHKAQGCEWRKVFIILHKDHAVSLYRELFYTAVTRAREECIVIAKDAVITKCIETQRIKGNTLEDKIEFFNSGAMDIGAVSCIK